MIEPTGYTALDLVGFTDKGTYSSSASYVKNDLVDYGDDKWQCMDDDVSNVTPTEGAYWHKWIDMPDVSGKADISAIGTNETGTTASRAYAVGEHFYKNGKFCTAIASIAQGATFTLGTNYVEGTVADSIRYKKLGTKQGGQALSLPSVYDELCILVYLSSHENDYTFNVPKAYIDSNSYVRLRNGYGYQSSNNYCNVLITNGTVTLANNILNSVEQVNSSYMDVYYR